MELHCHILIMPYKVLSNPPKISKFSYDEKNLRQIQICKENPGNIPGFSVITGILLLISIFTVVPDELKPLKFPLEMGDNPESLPERARPSQLPRLLHKHL